MARRRWLSSAHYDTLSVIWVSGDKDGWLRKRPGMNARSLHLLVKLNLLESRVVTGPRGGRHVELRVTSDGLALVRHVDGLIEGTGPTDEHGNFIRDVPLSRATFRYEGRGA